MHAVASLLPADQTAAIQTIWEGLETDFGLKGVQTLPSPHFSWHIACHYDEERLLGKMKKLSAEIKPFVVRTTGLGVFSGINSVIYIPVIKSLKLFSLHKKIWDELAGTGEEASPFYHPEQWIPHITLLSGDQISGNAGEIMKWLSKKVTDWRFEVDNLAFLYQSEGGKTQTKHHFDLKG